MFYSSKTILTSLETMGKTKLYSSKKYLILLAFVFTTSHAWFDNLLIPIYWQGKDLTILDNGIIIRNETGEILSFEKSKSWIEEDFFTQQDKYCELGNDNDN